MVREEVNIKMIVYKLSSEEIKEAILDYVLKKSGAVINKDTKLVFKDDGVYVQTISNTELSSVDFNR